MKFEEKIKELEKLVGELESEDVNLDDAINKYTNAMKLVKECDDELKKIETKVTKLVKNGKEEDFIIEESNFRI